MGAVQNTHVYMYKDGGEQWGIGSSRTTVTEETNEKICAIDSRLMESCIGWLGEGGGGHDCTAASCLEGEAHPHNIGER